MDTSSPTIRCTSSGVALFSAGLLAVGVVLAASASASMGESNFATRHLLRGVGRQGLFAVLGFLVMLAVARIGHGFWRWRERSWFQPSVWLGLAALACCVAVVLPGVGAAHHGARRWLHVSDGWGVAFQPSEMAKIALVVLLAALIASAGDRVSRLRAGVLPLIGVIALFAGLVGVEDFGTAALLATVGVAMLWVGGARPGHLVLPVIPGALAMGALVIARPYRVERLTTFLDIWRDPRGAGYHAIQSLVTIASGGWYGVGLGAGVGKRGYVPESHSDFVFSMLCEETGVVGGVLVILLYAGLLWCGWRAFRQARTRFGRTLAFGITFMVVLQAIMNIAVVTVCAPTKGISLPLVSAGGSGILFLCVALGLLMSVARASERQPAENLP